MLLFLPIFQNFNGTSAVVEQNNVTSLQNIMTCHIFETTILTIFQHILVFVYSMNSTSKISYMMIHNFALLLFARCEIT